MDDRERVRFLRRALPRMHMRWDGFRRVRRQVGRRIERRLRELGLPGYADYERWLEEHPDEWDRLDGLCRVTISRFYRDRAVGDHLRERVLPALCRLARERGEAALACWSAGCASGEEPYTISLLWHLDVTRRFPDLELRVLATDADPALLERAERAVYLGSSLRHLPQPLRRDGFEPAGEQWRLRAEFQQDVELRAMDVRREQPAGPFHVVLCRNLVFTYFDTTLQRELLPRLAATLAPGGALVVGAHERLPEGQTDFAPWDERPGVWRREVRR